MAKNGSYSGPDMLRNSDWFQNIQRDNQKDDYLDLLRYRKRKDKPKPKINYRKVPMAHELP
jgi:hypothetical protein